MRRMSMIVILLLLAASGLYGQTAPDVLKMVLDSVGFSRDDLGYAPKGYWSRFPLDIPYKLTSFDDLLAEPLQLYDYSKTMANAAEIYLSPSYLDSNSDALYKLTYALGVDRKLGGFRSYSANLNEVDDSADCFFQGVADLYKDWRKYGQERLDEYLRAAREMDDRLDSSPNIKRILAKLLININDIKRWETISFDFMIPEFDIAAVVPDKIDSLLDGTNYYGVDYLADGMDYWSLHYAALKSAALVELTADSLLYYLNNEDLPEFSINTPYGKIDIINNDGDSTICVHSNLLTIDIGSNTTYTEACCASSPRFTIDLGGDDKYISENNCSVGAGLTGVDIVYDASGNDQYIGKSFAQGAGIFGVGILYDRQGDDIYSAELMAQGAGYFGIGMLIDAAGDDSFYVYGCGQGFGGHGGGIGVLVDYDGDDKYVGEPSPEVYDIADYHSEYKINANFVQGVGYGRRADLSDGHSYAGGVGAIIDISGNDHYLSGNWSLGTGYWFATGIAYDGSGDDIYESCYFTQGSGAHFCNGILIDEGGNDRHELYETAGAALGFGWDFTNAFLINIGGDDSYKANMISIGCAEVRSNAFLIDIGGNDLYRVKSGALALGAVDYRDYYSKPAKLYTYFTDAKSIGGFIDIGGQDAYTSFTDSTEIEHPSAGNNKCWFKPEKSDSTYGANNYGVGLDIEEGVIPEIERWK